MMERDNSHISISQIQSISRPQLCHGRPGARMATDSSTVVLKKAGDWWKDDRRDFCAYCGIHMRRRKGPSTARTHASRDHIIPRAHKRPSVTIPACRGCNGEKGRLWLSEFVKTVYFAAIRARRNPRQWSLDQLWDAERSAVAMLKKKKQTTKCQVDGKGSAKHGTSYHIGV